MTKDPGARPQKAFTREELAAGPDNLAEIVVCHTGTTEGDVDAETVENERRIAEETAREEGKPEQALPKIIEGRVNGFFKENVLLDQAFAKDVKKSVGQVAQEAGAEVTGFARFKVGV